MTAPTTTRTQALTAAALRLVAPADGRRFDRTETRSLDALLSSGALADGDAAAVAAAALDQMLLAHDVVAAATQVAGETISKLATSEEPRRRAAAAASPRLWVTDQRTLASDDDVSVREALAANPVTLAEVLAELAGDSRQEVRAAVASNPSTPAATVAGLVGDRARDVRTTSTDALLERAWLGSVDAAEAIAGLPARDVVTVHETDYTGWADRVPNGLRLEVAMRLLGLQVPAGPVEAAARRSDGTVAELADGEVRR